MSDSAFYSLVELSLVYGLLIAFILYQLWTVRKRPDGTRGDPPAPRPDAAPPPAEPGSAPQTGHAERQQHPDQR